MHDNLIREREGGRLPLEVRLGSQVDIVTQMTKWTRNINLTLNIGLRVCGLCFGFSGSPCFFCHNHCHKFPKQKSGGKVLQDVEILVSYERTMHLCMLPAKKSPFRCLADLLRLCLQKKSTPKMAPDLVQGGFFSHLSSQDARKEYLWKESGEEARWKQSLWDSIHVMDSSGEIANERACGFLNAGCEAKCECSARMLVAGCQV